MKGLIAAIVIISGTTLGPAAEATPVSTATANAYYKACMAGDATHMTPDSQAGLCSCASAGMVQEMTEEEMTAMQAGPETPAGITARVKMTLNVYGPCLQTPLEDELARECEADTAIKNFTIADTSGLCRCMADKTGDFYKIQNKTLVGNILRKFPGIKDLYEALLEDQTFRGMAYNNINVCLHKY